MIPTSPPCVVAVVCDLFFGTKIGSTARLLGVDARVVRDVGRLAEEMDRSQPRLVLIDMDLPEAESVRAISEASAHITRPKVVAFVSHVHEHLARKAREMGADEVWPRSRFSHELPSLLTAVASPSGSNPAE